MKNLTEFINEYVINQKIKLTISNADIQNMAFNNPIVYKGVTIKFSREKIENLYNKLDREYKKILFKDLSNFINEYDVPPTIILNMYIPRIVKNEEMVFFGIYTKNTDKVCFGALDYDITSHSFECEDSVTSKIYSNDELKKMFKELS